MWFDTSNLCRASPYDFKAESKRDVDFINFMTVICSFPKKIRFKYLSKRKHPFYVENTVANMMKCIWSDSMLPGPCFAVCCWHPLRSSEVPICCPSWNPGICICLPGRFDSLVVLNGKLGKFTPGDADATCLSCRRFVMRWIWKVQRCFEGGTKFYAVWHV